MYAVIGVVNVFLNYFIQKCLILYTEKYLLYSLLASLEISDEEIAITIGSF